MIPEFTRPMLAVGMLSRLVPKLEFLLFVSLYNLFISSLSRLMRGYWPRAYSHYAQYSESKKVILLSFKEHAINLDIVYHFMCKNAPKCVMC